MTEELSVGGIFHGRYRVVRRLGAGAMGAVYEVIHEGTQRRRALKVMRAGLVAAPELRARFALEATVTAGIDSEHLVDTFDAGVDADTGAPFLVMELLRGEDLGAVLARRGRLPAAEALELLRQLAAALEKTHAAGVVHRDLKPENLFLTRRDDGSPRLKILDFGIAKLVSQVSHAGATQGVGTPIFMPPEQLHGHGTIGHRADLYALGQLAYVMLVGASYWEEEVERIRALIPLLCRIVAGPSEPASARARRRGVVLPPEFDAFFARATAPDPDDRFERASELVAAFAGALGLSLAAPRPLHSDRPPEGVVLDARGGAPSVPPGAAAGRSLGGKEALPGGSLLAAAPRLRPGLRDPSTFDLPDPSDPGERPAGRIPGERALWPFALLGAAALAGLGLGIARSFPDSFASLRRAAAAHFSAPAPTPPTPPTPPPPAEDPPPPAAAASPEASEHADPPLETPGETPGEAAASSRRDVDGGAPRRPPRGPEAAPRPPVFPRLPRKAREPAPAEFPAPEPEAGAGGSGAEDPYEETDDPGTDAPEADVPAEPRKAPPVGTKINTD